MDENKHFQFDVYFSAVALAIILAAVLIAGGLKKFGNEKRTVSVRGLSEREVPADMATWRVSFSVVGNDLAGLQKEILSPTDVVLDSVLSPEITDVTTNMYLDQSQRRYNYVAKQSVLIRTSKVQAVKEASTDTIKLMGKGVAVASDWDNRVSYDFTGLNEIKPEMIAEATKNARLAAEQFARDSDCTLGKISSASQGLFSIEDAATGLEEIKNVRVVTTVVYSLKK